MSISTTIVEVLAMLDSIDAGIAVSIVDRLHTLPDEPDRRFMAAAEMRGGWQMIASAPTRHEALAKLFILIRGNVLAQERPVADALGAAEQTDGRQLDMWRTP